MDLAKEARALDSLSRLVKAAEECRLLFDEAGMDYPAPLKRLLGEQDSAGAPSRRPQAIRIPPPDVSRPLGAADGWINVPMAAVNPQTVVLGILRDATAPIPVKQVVTEVKAKGSRDVNDGSIANIGTRLEKEGVIRRSDGGWSLTDRSRAPILNGKYAWGTPSMFMKQEVAARRREAILHVLGLFPAGLMNLQIVEQLEACPWLKTPLSKDLVKMDMEELKREGLVKRSGATKKWVLVADEKP